MPNTLPLEPTRAEPRTPRWLLALAWVALLGSLLPRLFLQQEAVPNIAGGLGLLALIALGWRHPLRRDFRLPVLSAWAFLLSGLLSSLIPHLLGSGRPELIDPGLHSCWNTIQAVTAAGLALHLCRDGPSRRSLCALLLLTVLLIAFWVLAESTYVTEVIFKGTKGNRNRFGTMLFAGSFFFWPFLLSGGRPGAPGRMVRVLGFLLLPGAPWLFLRKRAEASGGWHSYMESAPIEVNAVLLVCLAGALVWTAWVRWPRSRRWIALAGLLSLSAALCLAGSRAATGAFLLAGIVLLLRVLPGRWKIAAPLIASGALLILIAVFFRRFHTNAAGMLTHGLALRIRIAAEGLRLFLQDPLFGVGTGTDAFREAYARTFPSNPNYFEHAHNQVVHVLATQGIVGIATFLALLAACGARLLRAVRTPADRAVSFETREMSVWAFTGCIALAGMLANGIFERPLAEGNEVLFWLIPALGLAATAPPGNATQQTRQTSPTSPAN